MSRAEDTEHIIKIISDPWPGFIENNKGFFIDLCKTIFEPKGYTCKAENVPFARVLIEVSEGTADIAPALYKDPSKKFLYAKHFTSVDVTSIVINPKSIKWKNDITSVKGKTISWIRGFGFEDFFKNAKVEVKQYQVNAKETGIKMLAEHRVDAYLDNIDEINRLMTENKINPKDFEFYEAFKKGLYFGFTDNAKGKKLKEIFDVAIEKMYQKTGGPKFDMNDKKIQ